MKNKVFKILTMCFAFLIVLPCLCFLTACGCSSSDPTDEKPTEKEFVYEVSEDGKYVYLGSYAQTIKAYDVQIVSETPDANGYYKGSDGEKYIKHTVDISMDYKENVDAFIGYGMSTASDETVMDNGKEYYFKVEKLKWRVLSQNNDGNTLLICDNAIDSVAWQNNPESVPEGIYKNNYKYSSIRHFLNEDFYNKAFTSSQKELILTTEVDNSVASTPDVSEEYVCENTFDKVFLPSYSEITNDMYGFGELEIKNRLFKNTDYAKAKGVATATARFQGEERMDISHLTYLYSGFWGYSVAEFVDQVLNYSYKTGFVALRTPAGSDDVTTLYLGMETSLELEGVGLGSVPAVRVKLTNIDREDVYHEDRGYFKLTEYNGEYVALIIGDSMEMTEDDLFGVKLKSGKYNIRLGFEGYSCNPDYFCISVGFCLNGQAVEESEISTGAQALEYTTKIFVIEVDEESVLLFKNYGKCEIEKFDLLITKTA